jgi:MerR family transcriptional regulator, light-induced transcriptional regulator
MNLQEAADRLGVHYQTAYRWVREGRLTAMKVGATYEVTPEELDHFLLRRTVPVAPPERVKVRSWDQHRDTLYASLIDGNELEARNIVDRLHELNVPLIELCEELLAPTMRRVGDAWHDGTVSIAEEHRATAITERLLARVSTNPRGRPRGTALVVAAPGDQHSLPSAMAALVLRDERWKVHHLGGQLPIKELLEFARKVDADLVVLSLTFQPPQPERTYNGTRDISGLVDALEAQGHRVLLGGPGRTLSELIELAKSKQNADAPLVAGD